MYIFYKQLKCIASVYSVFIFMYKQPLKSQKMAFGNKNHY